MQKIDFKLVCFDLDSTLIDKTEFIWNTLYEHLGIDADEAKLWSHKFFSRQITYDEWCKNDLRLMLEKKLI